MSRQTLESPFTRPLQPRENEHVSYLEGPRSSLLGTIAAIAICQAAGALGFASSRDGVRSRWYRKLEKPEYMPPAKAFGPAWGVLYTLMGLSLYQLWQKRYSPEGKSALKWFAAQLALNASWTPSFFGARSVTGGLGVIGALLTVLPVSVGKAARVSRPAGLLLLPYLAWVGFAAVLNGAIARRNPRVVRKELDR